MVIGKATCVAPPSMMSRAGADLGTFTTEEEGE